VGRRACAADGNVTATGTTLQQPLAHEGSVTVSAIGSKVQRVTVLAGRLDATDAAGVELVQDLVFDDAGASLRGASVRAVAFGQHEDRSATASHPERVSDRTWRAGAVHTAHLTGKDTTMAVTLSALRIEPTPTARVAGAMRFAAEIWMAGAARAHMHLDLWLDPVTRLIREVQGTAHIDEALAAADLSFRSVC
jgi:hypothetical protein